MESEEKLQLRNPEDCYYHPLLRARQRYGLELDAVTLDMMGDMIASGEYGQYISATGADCEWWDVPIGFPPRVRWARVVYRPKFRAILTFIPIPNSYTRSGIGVVDKKWNPLTNSGKNRATGYDDRPFVVDK
jgi:hypothetical protein